MERAILNSEIRQGSGKTVTGKLRKKGIAPAIIYGKNSKPIQVAVNIKEFAALLHSKGENVIIDLKVKAESKTDDKTVIIKEMQYDVLNGSLLHVDFQQIKLTENIRIKVPLVTKGDAESPGIKAGGILERIIREVEVECLPTKIPKEIVIDVSKLELGKPVFVKELPVPQDVKLITDPELIVVLIKIEAEEVPAAEKPAEEVAAEPEVIKQKKREEEEIAGADKAAEKPKEKEKEKK